MSNFWKKLPKPFFCLAPMADVTDCVFREIIAKYSDHENRRLCESNNGGLARRSFSGGGPDVFWTEFVSADGLAHPEAREKLLIDFKYGENEHPIVAQIFGSNPKNIEFASKLCAELGFDGVDINMGCPDKSIEKQGAGACMIKNPESAREVIRAAKRGIASAGKDVPVSVKTRIGYNKVEIEEWLPALLAEDISALTIHARTRKEMSLVPARWEFVKRAVEIRNEMKKETLIIGNGDVLDIEDARKKVKETGCDGVMLGRAIFGNPWLFKTYTKEHISQGKNNFLLKIFSARLGQPAQAPSQYVPSLREKLTVMVEHTKLFEKNLGQYKNFAIMKKHYKAYVNNFDGAKELRVKLMEAENADEIEKITMEFLR